MVTADELTARSQVIASSADLQALLAHLRQKAEPLLAAMPPVPGQKAMLSMDGGICPDDGTPLTFEPWNPSEHRCPRCGKAWRGERHDRTWARFQHLWLAERAAHLAVVAAFGGSDDQRAAVRAREILTTYAERYWRYPNRDNVLGPSRLFFSTYLESLWICNYLAAAVVLRAAGLLDAATEKAVHQVTNEAATLIGDYDEGFSNRQTWNNAALTAVAVWFEDEELARRAIEGDTGLVAHLVRGYGRDGMWYEGENYHLLALRGLLTGAGWARLAGVDFGADERLVTRLQRALRAPSLTALPDFTFPARKDARFGISLAQPSYLELWEIGLARYNTGDEGGEMREVVSWLNALYALPAIQPDLMESYLHDAPLDRSPHPPSRKTLSWWSLLEMLPDLPAAQEPWTPQSVLLESQGLAILRRDDRYVSLEAGPRGGGHGHPDRLHLTLHAAGVHWLPDPGTGSYVARDLFWYRSTPAHNAPTLDGDSLPGENAICETFDVDNDWTWVRGRLGPVARTVVAGPAYIIDVLELVGRDEHLLELSWHIAGRGEVLTAGRRVPYDIDDEFLKRVHRFVPDQPGSIVLVSTAQHAQLSAHLLFDGELIEAEGPGLPGREERAQLYVQRIRASNARLIAVLEPGTGAPRVRAARRHGDTLEIETTSGVERHRIGATEWSIEMGDGSPRVLRGARQAQPPFAPLLEIDAPTPNSAPAFRVAAAPALDGTLDGFELAEPLELGLEDQYRRGEDAYPGPDDFSAAAYAAWDETALYLAVEVSKPDVYLRPGDAAPLLLDNEPDDIHSDGLQVYVAPASQSTETERHEAVGYLIVPEPGTRGVRTRLTSDTRANGSSAAVQGSWRRTDSGYCVTVAIPWPSGVRPYAGARVRFDLIVNEMLPGRMRRTGQLVWSGGGGWIWLRGDRQSPARFGVLELVG